MIQTNQQKTGARAVWEKMSLQGLYRNTSSGVFYSRYRMNGTRTFRSLKTDVLTIAKLRHADTQRAVEGGRQAGDTINADFRNMGALAVELKRRIDEGTIEEATRVNYRNWIARLDKCWPGDFATTPVRSVNLDFIIKLRNHLAGKATFKITNTSRSRHGYRPAVVNQTLTALRLLLKVAKEKSVISENPFDTRGALRESVYLEKRSRRPQLPSRADMERIFDEMGRVHDAERFEVGRRAFLQGQARDASQHARFLAFSGMRLEEANSSVIADDLGDTFRVRGTKTASSDRVVPVTPAFRALIAEIKTDRIAGKFLNVKSSRQALGRSCERLGLAKIRHHDLRHYFVTVCIENGVDIPTVAAWVGHADGGALLMKTYSHLRQEHSIAAAKTVNFSSPVGSGVQSNVG